MSSTFSKFPKFCGVTHAILYKVVVFNLLVKVPTATVFSQRLRLFCLEPKLSRICFSIAQISWYIFHVILAFMWNISPQLTAHISNLFASGRVLSVKRLGLPSVTISYIMDYKKVCLFKKKYGYTLKVFTLFVALLIKAIT